MGCIVDKELLFSITAADCRWDYFKGSGPGGQHRNKTASAVRCTHVASGAVGKCESSRSQLDNKREAFRKMAESQKFQKWARIEALRVMGKLREIEDKIDHELRTSIKVEYQIDGKWVNE